MMPNLVHKFKAITFSAVQHSSDVIYCVDHAGYILIQKASCLQTEQVQTRNWLRKQEEQTTASDGKPLPGPALTASVSGCCTRRSICSSERWEWHSQTHDHAPLQGRSYSGTGSTYMPLRESKGKEGTLEGANPAIGKEWRTKRLWMNTGAETAVMRHGVGGKCSSKVSSGKQNRHYNTPNLNFLGFSGYRQLPVAESICLMPPVILKLLVIYPNFITRMQTSRWKQDTNKHMWVTKLSSHGISSSH